MDRRNWLIAAASLAAAGCGGARVAQEGGARLVRIHTRKFDFVPSEITLAKGEPVLLELIADDIAMGFRCSPLSASSRSPRRTGTSTTRAMP